MMRSLIRTLLVATSVLSPLTKAELTFKVTSVQQDGRNVDTSSINFVPIPPLQHRKHPSRLSRAKGERDTISYSSNWCGASQHASSQAEQDAISNIFGYFTVPDLMLRDGHPAPQFAAAWVGIDGAECNSALLQAGVTTIVNSNGGQSASAWWEWYPNSAFTIEGLRVRPGEWIGVNITAIDATTAQLVIINADQGQSMTLDISNGPPLCRIDAEWIMEDFYDSGEQVTFARFSDLWFVDAAATTVGGQNVGIDGATMVYLQADDGAILCSAEPWDNSNFVAISH
ncbi:hypothetical protein VTK26DRAFT_1171 [Humicola hyalothermophila]